MMQEKERGSGDQEERMRKRLYEASLSGNVSSLIELMKEDELILDRVMIRYFNQTPLHIAAVLGHLDFARELLRCKPELAAELDSENSSPLHLASAKGILEMVKELVRVNPDVCCVIDRDGRTPLHLAAIKSRIDVMKELIQAQPDVILVRVNGGKSILHLCVEYNRLEALKLLLDELTSEKAELLNSKDDDGNTALHIATTKKNTKVIESLLNRNGVEVNVLNCSGFTALDVLAHCPRDIQDMEISESLRVAGALRAKDLIALSTAEVNNNVNNNNITVGATQPRNSHLDHNDDEWLQKSKDSLMIVSTVIATMAFQAATNPPGGVWGEDKYKDPNNTNSTIIHHAGTSIMATKGQYGIYINYTTLSFVGSMSITLLLISGLRLKRRIVMWILMAGMWGIITSLIYAYGTAIDQLTPPNEANPQYCQISVLIWMILVNFILLVHTGRWLWGLPLKNKVFIWTSITLIIITSVIFYAIGGERVGEYVWAGGLFLGVVVWCVMAGLILSSPGVSLYLRKHWEKIKKAGLKNKRLFNSAALCFHRRVIGQNQPGV